MGNLVLQALTEQRHRLNLGTMCSIFRIELRVIRVFDCQARGRPAAAGH